MELNSNAIQEVVQLNLDLIKVNNQIAYVKKLINQLLQDKCDLSVSFNVHNQTRCDENKATSQIEDGYTLMDGFLKVHGLAMSGYPLSTIVLPRDTQHPCRNKLNFQVTDTNGVRILSILLAERQETKRLLLDKINLLIKPVTINFPTADNPIHDRYSAE